MGASIMKARDIANFTKTNWGQLASHARGLIVKDMNDGVMQNGIKKYNRNKASIATEQGVYDLMAKPGEEFPDTPKQTEIKHIKTDGKVFKKICIHFI